MGEIVVLSTAAISALFVLGAYIRNRAFFRGAAFSALTGLGALAAVNAAGAVSGVSIALNMATIGVSLTLGVPGVAAMLFMRLIVK